MGSTRQDIDDNVRRFINAQKMFFVATAPLAADGHVNLSPKGLNTFRVLGPRRVAYLDYTGSGVETIAHIRENGRLTIMFCSFEGKPNILRLHGRGWLVEAQDAAFESLMSEGKFEAFGPARAIIGLDVQRIADSCGFGVPLYEYRGDRAQIPEWCGRKGAEGVREYQLQKNARSIDGLPGLPSVTR